MMTKPLLHLLSAAFALATALPADAAPREAAITLSGKGPYYALTLPVAVYLDALRPDLADVRIVNAKGDLVPHAWTYIPETVPTTSSAGAPIFSIAVPDKGGSNEPLLQLRRRTDGTLVMADARPARAGERQQWIIDASRIDGALVQARFRLAAGSDGLFPFILEAGDDLLHWRLVSADEQLASISRQGVRIERLDVPLGGVRPKYLRLRWRDPSTAVEIEGVTLDSVGQTQGAPRQQWSAAIPPQTCAKDYCDYALPAGTPLDALRVQLAETNTLGTVQIVGRWSAERPAYRHRNPLYALRHKHAEPPSTERQSLLASFTAYRLNLPAGEMRSPDLPLDGGIYASLRLKSEGAISLLGNPPPTIAVGTMPRALVFLASGEGPFKLVWGKEQRDGEAMAFSTLIPKLPQGQVFIPDPAEVVIASTPASVPAATLVLAAKPEPANKAWLWAALGVGLLLLGGMAWSLFRSMGKEKQGESL
ncbi:MAG: DUF3999 domain-containing protein [Betaproteobacteria bacterium]